MSRWGSSPFSFPAFRGVTRGLILLNVAAYFLLLLSSLAGVGLAQALALVPPVFLHGAPWQLLTYSFVHVGISGTMLELLSLWFLLGFLEQFHKPGWVLGVYAFAVIGAALSAVVIFVLANEMGYEGALIPLYGCFGGIFGLLTAMGVLHGDVEFLLFFTIGIKARVLAIIYALVALAMLFGQQRIYAVGELGGAVAAILFIWFAPQRGLGTWASERWFGLANSYYRWKRRRAGRKFEVYMRQQGKTVHLDGYGKRIEDDPNDKKRWN
jgi:membrane associated rhomboid family serine protease